MDKRSVYDLSFSDLTQWIEEQGEKSYRAKQIWHFLYVQRVRAFNEMHNIGQHLQTRLAECFIFETLTVSRVQESFDGTIKFLFELVDKTELIETVLMKHDYGYSVCVTTQIGCNIGCTFCASGQLKKQRDLSAGEIVAQIMNVQMYLDGRGEDERVRSIVVMGIGEPFDNYDNTMRFIRIVNDQQGLSIGARHITVSTSGLAHKIESFANEGIQVNLALSLHAPNNELRTKIMRINRVFPLEKLLPAIWHYIEQTKRRVTFEYIMIDQVNDGVAQAKELVGLIPRHMRQMVYVNLIPYNPVASPHVTYKRAKKEQILKFYDVLKKNGITVIIRQEHGTDIDAACGQLRAKKMLENMKNRQALPVT